MYIYKVFEHMLKNKNTNSVYGMYIIDVATSRMEVYNRLEAAEFEPWDNQF